MGCRNSKLSGAVALIAAALATRLYSFQGGGDARTEAWASARSVIPQFLTWAQPAAIYPCGSAKDAGTGRIDFSESLLFNPAAAQRMCGNLTGPDSTRLALGSKGWKQEPEIRPFEPGSVLAAALWYPLSRTKDPALGSPLEIRVRKMRPKDDVATRKLRIMIPEKLRGDIPGCPVGDVSGAPATSDFEDVSIEKFHWVQLQPGEQYQSATCGDFAILIGFHLVHKTESKGWLWSTFWWDDSPSSPFSPAPATIPAPWSNYAMDAAYSDPESIIYNPWRDAEVADRNCAACHRKLATNGEPPGPTLSFDMVITARAHF